MKFTIARSRFLDGLKSVQNVVAGKGSLPVLQNVLLEAEGTTLTMTTTDLDISIRCTVDCEVQEPGATTLPVKLLFSSISKAAEGLVEISVDENENATIVAGSAKFRLAGLAEREFPRLPEDDEAMSYEMPDAQGNASQDVLCRVAGRYTTDAEGRPDELQGHEADDGGD